MMADIFLKPFGRGQAREPEAAPRSTREASAAPVAGTSAVSSTRYTPLLRAIHWLVTILLVAQFALILCTSRLQSFEFANTALDWHRACGIVIMVLILVGAAARRGARSPQLETMTILQRYAAHFVHASLLGVTIALAGIGILMTGARGDTLSFFGLFDIPAVIGYDPDLSDTLLAVHGWLAVMLGGLVVLHIAAVGFHLQVQKRNTMRRMLPSFHRSVLVNHVPIWAQMLIGSGCLLALMIGVGAYAEHKTAEATRLNQALFNEIFVVSADITTLDKAYAEFMLNFGTVSRENLAEMISPLKDGAVSIKEKTDDSAARDQADAILKNLTLIEAEAGKGQEAVSALLSDTDQAIDDLTSGHMSFVFRQRLAVEGATTFGHDMILISVIPAVLLGLMVVVVLSRNLLRVIGTARSLASSIALGNLENDLRVEGKGEAAQLARDLLSMQTSLRDTISALKATAAALQQSEDRVLGIAESLPGFLFQCFITRSGGIGFRVICSNKFDFDSAAMTKVKNCGDLSLDIAMKDDRLGLEKAILDAHDGNRNWEHVFRVPTLDGSFRSVRATAVLAHGTGPEMLWNGIALDETDRLAAAAQNAQLQAKLQHAEKIESIGTLAGGMAHELNNLLQPMIMMTELVLMDLPEDSSHHAKLKRVVDAGSMAAEIVQRIVVFGRSQEVSQSVLDVAEVARDAVALIRTILPSSIKLEVDIDDCAGNIRGDKTQMTQILINLATNARDAIGGRTGTVWVSLSKSSTEVELPILGGGTLKPGTFVTISVKDTGSGMDEATVKKIFEPFFTTKGVGQGTGLGLSVTHGIVASHGGAIQVDSAPGKGTTFSIHLPIEEEATPLALAS